MNYKHGRTRTTEFKIWDSMIQRCENPNSPDYHRYRGRGIRVCRAWLTFEGFFADVGIRPNGAVSLDRIDNDLGYYLGNVRWSTKSQQARNRRNNRRVTAFGETFCLAEWSERFKVKPSTLYQRLRSGWSPEDAVSTPTRTWRPR